MAAGDYDTVYLAADGYLDELLRELAHRGERVTGTRERLVFARGGGGAAAWAQNTWLSPRELPAESIGQAAHTLRAIQRNWLLHSVDHHRRARLIAERLPAIRFRPLAFPCDPPTAPLGAWTLTGRDRMIASPACTSPFPDGGITFVEDREGPPNRAYLKLWEALTLARARPGPGDRCLDLGAAPGGWTWVLSRLGTEVVSIDRAPLAPTLADDPRIEHRRGDAFKLKPEEAGAVSWVLSDVVAYPERMLELARRWAQSRPDAAMIFTLKFQGAADPETVYRFLEIPGSRLMHLSHNKHELTWFRLPGGGPPEAAGAVLSA